MGRQAGAEPEELKYVERLDVGETFVDSLQSVMYDGNALRMEFVVHRFSGPMANGKTGKLKVTAVRLVIPLGGAINLTTQLNAMMGALEQQGAIGEVTFLPPTGGLN